MAAINHSILHYLRKNGFSKTFKKFLKEAQIEEDNLKTSLDLEDVYSRYSESRLDVDKHLKTHKEQGVTVESGMADLSEEAINKKKKKDKKGLEKDDGNSKQESEETFKSKDKKENHKLKPVSIVEDDQKTKKDNNAIDIPEEDCTTEEAISKKKKKKDKKGLQKDDGNGKGESEETSKSKDKKEKHKSKSVSVVEDDQKNRTDNNAIGIPEDETKKSKKRKLSATDESENKDMKKLETGESKRRKTKDSQEAKVDGSTNGDLKDNGIQKSSGMKSARKPQNISAERKTAANAYQRVKADEIEFADERLQDNSYWAKAGAENGYGAKAQEILGQVKGRDFRHEKTKKKRGSYRGGQIDFGSHSIKFKYDDDE